MFHYYEDKILISIMWLCIIALAAFVGYVLFILLDSALGTVTNYKAVLVGRDYSPEAVIYTNVNQVRLPTIVPETWYLEYSIPDLNNITVKCSVDSYEYNSLPNSHVEEITVSSGLFTSDYYCY